MKKEKQSDLINHVINPVFLEEIKQSIDSITIKPYMSFDMVRNGKKYGVTMYSGSTQVNISSIDKDGWVENVIITDYCENMLDFLCLMEKLDDLAKRRP